MTLNIISALTQNRIIGKNADLPWDLPDDWNRLQVMVKNKPIVMGRKTYESAKSFLTENINYIFSTQEKLDLPGNCRHIKDLPSFLQTAEGEIFVLGGGEIYNLLLPHSHRLHLTLIETELDGDTYFPTLDPEWLLESSIYHPSDKKHQYGFYFNSYIRNFKA